MTDRRIYDLPLAYAWDEIDQAITHSIPALRTTPRTHNVNRRRQGPQFGSEKRLTG